MSRNTIIVRNPVFGVSLLYKIFHVLHWKPYIELKGGGGLHGLIWHDAVADFYKY
jgi:hypothetical protein